MKILITDKKEAEKLKEDMKLAADYILGIINAPRVKDRPKLTIDIYWAAINLNKLVDDLERNKMYEQKALEFMEEV